MALAAGLPLSGDRTGHEWRRGGNVTSKRLLAIILEPTAQHLLPHGDNLAPQLARWEPCRMDIGVGGIRDDRVRQRLEVPGTAICPGMGWMLAAVHVPETVPLSGRPGAAGPLPRFEQKNTRTPPEARVLPK